MKAPCLGGGPARVRFVTGMKLRNPSHRATVLQRDRAGDTFDWGVVLFDEALGNMAGADSMATSPSSIGVSGPASRGRLGSRSGRGKLARGRLFETEFQWVEKCRGDAARGEEPGGRTGMTLQSTSAALWRASDGAAGVNGHVNTIPRKSP